MSSENPEPAKQKRKAVQSSKTPAIPRGKPAGTPLRAASPARQKRVTIADVARRAGVSTAAVSFTLSDRRDIALAETTRDRIRRCADELGYFPNRLGAGFLRGRSKLVGVLILADSYRPFLDCISGIHHGLAEADCFPLLMSHDWIDGHAQNSVATDRQRESELMGIRRLIEYQVDGVLHFSTHAAHTAACAGELAARGIPMVVLGGVDPYEIGIDTVGGDNEKIGRMAAEHLLSVGCASFAFGMPTVSHPLDAVVRASFLDRLGKAGRDCTDFRLDPENPCDVRELLSRLVRPPAGIFCTRDDVAALALRAAFSLGWPVPRDCAVVAMGEAALSRFNALPITTINRNSFAAGAEAAKLLVRRIEGFTDKPQRILISPSFELRASSRSEASWLLQSPQSVPSYPAPPAPSAEPVS